MDYKFLTIDMSVVTFYGLSRSYQRRLALMSTLFILAALMGFLGLLPALLVNVSFLDEMTVLIFLITFVHYLLTDKFLFLVMARKLFDITPLGILFTQDMSIIDKAKKELLSISEQFDFQEYQEYGKINPSIRSLTSIEVIKHQKDGTLDTWINKPGNLKRLANLVYQIYLVEEFLDEDV